MNTAVTTRGNGAPASSGNAIIENVLIQGDLAKLSPAERTTYYMKVCESVGLNPMTQPFAYITLNGKMVLYALRACADQLRAIHNVSVEELTETTREGVHIVTAKVRNGQGRTDMAKGAVTIGGLKGDALANALMKAETKAKRRATLSICGLSLLDEIEIETIPNVGAKKRLSKKDAREIYQKMEPEVRATASRPELDAWEKNNKERMEILPEDWEDVLVLQIQEHRLDLQNRERTAPAIEADPPHDPETGVIWDEDGERDAPIAIAARDWRHFGEQYVAAIKRCKSIAHADEWAAKNINSLDQMKQDAPKMAANLATAIAKLRLELVTDADMVGDGEVLMAG